MPTIKTIKASGGDYTTLQSWEDWADGEATADQWAEVYASATAGAVNVGSWASTPDATTYPKIYSPLAERHDGIDGGTDGACISWTSGNAITAAVNYLLIDGLKFKSSGSGNNLIAISWTSNHIQIHNNFHHHTGTGSSPRFINGEKGTGTFSAHIWGNFAYQDGVDSGASVRALRLLFTSNASNNPLDLRIYNNTFLGAWDASFVVFTSGSGTFIGDMKVENNACFEATTACYLNTLTRFTGTLTYSHNASSDATADDDGATGAIVSATTATEFVDENVSAEIPTDQQLYHAGVDVSSDGPTEDFHGRTWTNFSIGCWNPDLAAGGNRLLNLRRRVAA